MFYLAQEYYWPSMEPIYRAFTDAGGYDLYLQSGKNARRFLGIFLFSQKGSIEAGYKKAGYKVTDETQGFDAVFCGAPIKNPAQFGDALLCNVDHGPGIKTLRYRHFLKQPDTKYICFIEGPYRAEKFRKYGLDKIEEIYDVGLPKLDVLFDGTFNKDELMQEYQLDSGKKTVLYAPSYKPTSIFEIGESIVKLSDQYNVMVKLHPYSWSGKYASHKQHRLFEKLPGKYPDFHLMPKEAHNILPMMFIADTMISDGSSVINEFLALERCGIIYNLEDEKLKHRDGQPLLEDKSTEWLKDSFIHINRPGEIAQAVSEALQPSQSRMEHIKKDKQYIFSKTDGQSAQRVKETVEKLINEKAKQRGIS